MKFADLTLSTLTGSSDTCCLRGPPWSIMSSSGTQNFQSSGCPSGSPSERRPAAKALEFTICAAARHLLGQCKECILGRLFLCALRRGKRSARYGASNNQSTQARCLSKVCGPCACCMRCKGCLGMPGGYEAHRVCPSEVLLAEAFHERAVTDLAPLKARSVSSFLPVRLRHKALQLIPHAVWESPIQTWHRRWHRLSAEEQNLSDALTWDPLLCLAPLPP